MASKIEQPNTVTDTSPAGAGVEAAALQEKPEATKPTDAVSPPETAPATGTTDIEKKVEALTLVPEERHQTTEVSNTEPANPDSLVPEEHKQAVPAENEKKVKEATPAVAAAPASTTTDPTSTSSGPTWPETGPDHPLTKFFESIGELTEQADHNEIWGITLSKSNEFLTKLILQKYLRANANDLTKAKEQLLDTLKWRKEFEPVKAAEASYEKDVFEGLGYIIETEGVPESENKKDIITFNIYGAVKDNKKTFGDIERFLKWRVGLMERSVQKLNISAATKPIPDHGQGSDPYQGIQIHDYLQVSFFRQDPVVKAATKQVIETLGRYYPETLSRKFFVNVPVVMGWVFQAVKLFVAKETVKKFTVLSYGDQLAGELGQGLPKEYGGQKGELKEVGEGMSLN